MVREVLTVSVGQCGIQSGYTIWKNFCAEHYISETGQYYAAPRWKKHGPTKILDIDKSFLCFFEETGAGQFVPRTIMVDLEPNVIDDIKLSPYKNIFHPEFLLAGTEDAGNNFARGHYTVGKEIIDKVNDRLRKLVDNCDNVQGFVMTHAIGGGTGSGLGALILERLAVDYRKKAKLSFTVYPSPTISTNVVEPYNALLSQHWLLDHTEVTCVLDNEALYEMNQKWLDIRKPDYEDLNSVIAKVVSSFTCGLRFEGELNVDLNEYQTSLVPFPRLHFHISGISPLTTPEKKLTARNDVQSITEAAFNPQYFCVKIADFDVEEDKYMSCHVQYRGDVKAKEANACVQWLKTNKKVCFVEWCPTGFKVGLNDIPCKLIEGDKMAEFKRNIVSNNNNTAISRVFSERMSKPYDLMYNQRAFVHWFVGEGMEEGEFCEAREDLGFLEKDYLDVLSEQATDEESEEDD